MSGPHDGPCPSCGSTAGVQQLTGTPPKVAAWSCMQWATSMVSPRPLLDQLTVTVELAAMRSVLRELIRLAGQAPVLTEEQLRFRLLALAQCAAPPRSPAGRWSSKAPDSAPGGQPAPQDSSPQRRDRSWAVLTPSASSRKEMPRCLAQPHGRTPGRRRGQGHKQGRGDSLSSVFWALRCSGHKGDRIQPRSRRDYP
ncbi:MAG: hypothetical protein ACRDRA_11045 [Pseudonocardiaceae bacterium]